MEINFDRSQMVKAVNVSKAFAETASRVKVLQSVSMSAGLGRVRLTTTDLSLWCQVGLDARTPQSGTAVVPARLLGTVLKTLPQSDVSLRKEGDDVCLSAGSSQVRVAGVEAHEYPDIRLPQGRLAALPLCAALVNEVAYAVSKDTARYTLNGVRVEVGAAGLDLVATDGHRLARFTGRLPVGSVRDVEGSEVVSGIVPVRLLTEGVRLGSQFGSTAVLEMYEKEACMRVNSSIMLWARLLEGQYPDYEGVVPSAYSGCITLTKGVLGAAVSRLAALLKGCRVACVRLTLADGMMVLKAEDAGAGVSAVERLRPSAIEGSVPACGLNVRHLSEALERLPDAASAQLRFSDDRGQSPVAVESPARAGLVALLMPLRL